MDDVQIRLARCFAAVFPKVPAGRIPAMTQVTTDGWDSTATATLYALIEEEFGVALDSGELDELDSFATVREFLSRKANLSEGK